MEIWNNTALPDVPMPIAAPAATQPTPLPVSALVDNSNPTEFDHTVDEVGMCAGGFTQNATCGCGLAGTRGVIDVAGVLAMRHDIADYPTAAVFWGDLLLINKPQFKRFEMHGSLPAVLQYGAVVSASKLHKQIGRRSITIEHANGIRIQKSAGRGRDCSKYPKEYEQEIYKEVDK